jgi:hypothetical protein
MMNRWIKKLLFPFIGIASLIWFLIRVIPKPSRASYPCMRAAAPFASSFVLYMVGMFSTMFIFKKAGKLFKDSRYVLYSVTLFLGILMALGMQIQQSSPAHASLTSTLEGPNEPMGTGVGVKPGRVAWIYNRDATDENCTNTKGDYWFQDDNTNQTVVTSMLSEGLQLMTGETSDAAAWNAIFHNYNRTHGRGDVGYTAGEKIVIKINLNGFNNSNSNRNINTSPQICYAVLNQLVNVVGAAQTDIGMGDGGGNTTYFLPKCKSDFPNVKYWPGNEMTASKNFVFFSSNGGWETTLSAEAWKSRLPQAYMDAAYMINIPVFKKHHRAGISIGAKNHVGSINSYAQGAQSQPWHISFPCPVGQALNTNGEYGVYRDLVDIMAHKDLGGKTILYIVDGIWGSVNWGHPPVKWQMPPFNNDWPNSLFLSQDPVASESVCFDFLYYEFDENNLFEGGEPDDNRGPFPHFAGVDDYLHQAADSLNWPAGIAYDPEHDGIPIPRSLGAHEHWNNAIDKKYSQNLGLNQGIDLASNLNSAVDENRPVSVKDFSLDQNYPNPFNPTTTITYHLAVPSDVTLTLYNAKGETIKTLVRGFHAGGSHEAIWNGLMENGFPAPSGVYYYHLTARNEHQTFDQSNRMLLCK